jgi:hypothetical protein
MDSTQDFKGLYRDVSENMAAAMAEVSKLTVSNKEGQERLDHIAHTLTGIQSGFDAELEFLEVNAEWEKFTMAFFGETNAGKSTIIESLRILFNESSRQQLIEDNQQNLDELARKLQAHANHAETALADAFQKHARGVGIVRKGCGELKVILAEGAVLMESTDEYLEKIQTYTKQLEPKNEAGLEVITLRHPPYSTTRMQLNHGCCGGFIPV